MLKNKKQPKHQLQIRNHSNRNDVNSKKNIFQLIKPIPKSLPIISKNIRNKFDFAENLITFLSTKYPETLSELSFNIKKDNIESLISKLSKAIIDLNYVIVFDDQAGDKALKIIYSVSEKDWMWYVIEYAFINKIEPEELKIGFTYLIEYIGKYCFMNTLQYDYFQTDDNVFENEFEMMMDDIHTLNDNDDIDEGLVQEVQEQVDEELIRLRSWKDKFLKYINMSYSIFLDYTPKNKYEEAFKEFIIKGLTLNFNVNSKFISYHNVDEYGGLSFEASMLLFFEMDKGVEQNWFTYIEEQAQNDNSGPAGWYLLNKGIVTEMTTKKDIEDLKENFQYISDLYDKHLNNIEKWNI